MLVKNIKEEIRKLNRRNCSVHQLDPEFNDLRYMRSYIYIDRMELHKFADGSFQVIKINFDDIVKVDINGIDIYIELKNGASYFLKEIRNDLKEIFTDFKGKTLDISINGKFFIIKDYSLIGQDYDIYILKGTTVYNEELGDLEENEYVDFKYKLRFDDIKIINEDYEEGYHNLLLELVDGQYIEFTPE